MKASQDPGPEPAAADIAQKMRADWDRRARIDPRYWVAATAEADEASYRASAVRDAAELLDGLPQPLAPTARVLDLGCGIGRLSAQVAGHCAEVIGVDVSPEMIAAARRLHAGPSGLRFATNSGVDLADFPDGYFDLVFSYSVLPHVPEDVLECYFLEVGRVLRVGGIFRYQFWIGPRHAAGGSDTLSIRTYEAGRVAELHAEAGLELLGTETIAYFDPLLQMHPVWVNACKREAPRRRVALPALRVSGAEEDVPLEYDLLIYLALKHGERGELDDAERVIEQAVALNPGRGEAYVQWATWRLAAEDLKGALGLIETMNRKVPDSPHGWLYRAQFSDLLGDLTMAHYALGRLHALNPDEPELLAQAEELARKLGEA